MLKEESGTRIHAGTTQFVLINNYIQEHKNRTLFNFFFKSVNLFYIIFLKEINEITNFLTDFFFLFYKSF